LYGPSPEINATWTTAGTEKFILPPEATTSRTIERDVTIRKIAEKRAKKRQKAIFPQKHIVYYTTKTAKMLCKKRFTKECANPQR